MIAKQLFPGEFIDEEGNRNRNDFNSFTNALVTLFVCLTGTWVDVAYNVMNIWGVGYALFFIQIMVIGNFLLLNLFLAILLENTDD